MNLHEVQNHYFSWLLSKTVFREINGWIEVTTPYLDRHNDYIQIYLRQDGKEWELSDDGGTLSDLKELGQEFVSIEGTLSRFGLCVVNGEIMARTTNELLPMKMHDMVHALVRISE